MTYVQFNVDQYPHVKGDTTHLDDDELKQVDAEAERRGVDDTYTVLESDAPAESVAPVEETASEEAEAEPQVDAEAPAEAEAPKKSKGGKK